MEGAWVLKRVELWKKLPEATHYTDQQLADELGMSRHGHGCRSGVPACRM